MQSREREGETSLVIQQPPAPRSSRGLARRAWRWARGACLGFIESFRDPRLADFLPPLPEVALVRGDHTSAAERGERLLLEVLCAPPEYLRALAAIVEAAERRRVLTRALRHLACDEVLELLPAREGDRGPRFDDEMRGPIGRVKLRRPI